MRILFLISIIVIVQFDTIAQQARELNNTEQQKVEQLLEQLNEFHNSGKYEKAGKTSSDIAFIYLKTGNLKESIKHYTMSVEYLTEVDNLDMLPNVYSNIAGIYTTQGEYQTALDYFLKSLNIRLKSGNKESVLIGSLDVASSYQVLGSNAEAIEYLEEGLGLATDINNPRLTLDCYHLLAQNNEQLGYEKEAEAWMVKAEKLQAYLDEQSRKEEDVSDATESQKEVDKAKAEQHLERQLTALQKVISQQKIDSLKALQEKQDSLFMVAQKERLRQKEIDILEQNRALEVKLIEEQKGKKRLIILAVIGGFILLIVLVVALTIVNRKQNRAKSELEKKNEELAKKNEQMIKDMLK